MKASVLESPFNKVAGLSVCNFIKKETPAQMFSCEYCKNFKNSFLYRTSPVAAFVSLTLSLIDTE